MPTGYTASIVDGKREISFQEFAMDCARNFGALISMRDMSHDAKIPERFEPSDYHLKEIEKLKVRQNELRKMTDLEAEALAHKEWEDNQKEIGRHLDERREIEKRLNSMVRKVESWTPPTMAHEELKEFMRQQLQLTIESDATSSRYLERLRRTRTGHELLSQEFAETLRKIDYHLKEHQEEVDRTEERNRWIAALRASLVKDVEA